MFDHHVWLAPKVLKCYYSITGVQLGFRQGSGPIFGMKTFFFGIQLQYDLELSKK